MSKKFQPLDYSRGWDDYWRDHPQGYSPQEQMVNWSGQLNAMIDFFNEYFDVDLTEYATNVMEGWYFDGRLEDIINEALFNSKADKAQTMKVVNVVEMFNADNTGSTDSTQAIQNAIEHVKNNSNSYLFFPEGTYLVTSTLDITHNGIKIVGVKRKSVIKYSGTGNCMTFDTTDTTMSGVEILNMSFVADIDQQVGVNNTFDTWFPATAIYLNGSRFQSKLDGCYFSGFEAGVHSHRNWYMLYNDNLFVGCKRALYLDEECNNSTLSNNMFLRCGDNPTFTGYACKIKQSYALTLFNNNIERCRDAGFIYENCHGVTHIGGNIEGNNYEIWKIQIMGLDGATLATDRFAWSYGISIIGVRFRNSLGVRLSDGSRKINIQGITVSMSGGGETPSSAITTGNATLIEDINLLNNDLFGNPLVHGDVPLKFLTSDRKTSIVNQYHMIESPEFDLATNLVMPFGYFPDKVKITKVQLVINKPTATTGSCTINIGVGADVGKVITDTPFTGGDPTSSPYGVYEVNGYNAVQNSGVLRAQLRNTTFASGAGSVRVRVYYEITG